MPTAAEIFSDTPLYTDDIVYTMVTLPPNGIIAAAGLLAEIREPFLTCILDKDECTLVMPMMAWEDFSERLPESKQAGEFRLITFDVTLDFDVIGFMAYISQILATANISLMAISAFARDHILVNVEQFQAAWDALEKSKQGK